ncbi:MAG: hypothetical protein WDN23_21945 [Edaphobacter sp.]
MKNAAISLLILCTSFTFAATNAADYPQTVHVTSSHLIFDPSGRNPVPSLQIDVVVNGKRYVLLGSAPPATVHVVGGLHSSVLPVGDYKARSISSDYGPNYLLFLSYEILLPDGTTAKFDVVGGSE